MPECVNLKFPGKMISFLFPLTYDSGISFEVQSMKDWAKSFYKSKAWQAVRENVMQRDARLCVDCLAEGRYTAAEEVHHIEELTPENIKDPAVALNMSNLVSLCRECHKKRHGARANRYKVDEFGRVTIA